MTPAQDRILELQAEVRRLKPFERYIVCHWCGEQWERAAVPRDHACFANPLVKILVEVADFFGDLEAIDSPSCDPETAEGRTFLPLASRVRGVFGVRTVARDQPYEIRRNDDGSLDEVAASNPKHFHLEQMDSAHWWLSIDMPDGTAIHVNLTADEPIDGKAEVNP